MEAEETNEEIIEQFSSEKLTSLFFRRAGVVDERNEVVARYVALHNDKRIDFLKLVDTSEFESLSASDFFVGQNLCCKIIPQLDDDLSRMVRFVDKLVKKGGAI